MVFGLLFLPGYLFLGIEKNILLLLFMHSAIVGYSLLRKSTSRAWLSISTFFSLALPLFISQGSVKCENIAYLPWLLNIILMSAFIFATEIRNKFLRWVPIAIISTELFLLPQNFPSGCQDIFLGSIPAIPLIIAFALVLGSLRKRLYKQDAEQISSVFVDEANVRNYEDSLEVEYKTIISELEDFSEEVNSLSDPALSIRIENEIQKIRAFLVCSEQFESEIVRELYRFVIGRLRSGVPTRLNILGGFIYQLDQSTPIGEFLTKLSRELGDIPSEITLVKLREITFDINVENKYLEQIKPITVENITVRLNPSSK